MNRLTNITLAVLLLAPLAAPHLNGAPNSDFDPKAATLFTKKYFFHAWNKPSTMKTNLIRLTLLPIALLAFAAALQAAEVTVIAPEGFYHEGKSL
jgi:hypothetical protein